MTDEPDIHSAYDRWADCYDSDDNRTRELAGEVLRRTSLSFDGLDVVEIGCGTGRNTVWLAEKARGVVALDFSAGMLRRAAARVGSPHVIFHQHDIRKPWPVADSSADAVVVLLVLEHVERLEGIFAEAARVLRPGGAIFACELHPMRQMLGRQAEFVNPETGACERVPAFLHDVSDYLTAGLKAGLILDHAGEWRDEHVPRTTPPRLLSLLFPPSRVDAIVASRNVTRSVPLAATIRSV